MSFFRKDYDLDFFIKGYKKFFLSTSKNNSFIFENFILEPEKSLKSMCSSLKIDYDKNFIEKLKNVNVTGDPNALNATNIQTKDSISKKKLISEDELNNIKNRADFINLIKDFKSYYQNV